MKLLVIIPAYNEESNIDKVISNLKDNFSNYSDFGYVIINDGSTDNTKELPDEKKYNHIDLPCNMGLSCAMQLGYKYGYENNYDCAIQFDGDGQHDINSLPQLLDPVINGEKDFVVGSRFLHGQSEFKSTILRRIGISYLSFIIKVFSGCSVNDPTSGFRAANRKAIKYLSANYPVDYPEPESLVDLSRHSFRIGEVQVNMLEREGGISSISSWKSVYYMIKVSLAIICSSLQRKVGD